MTSAVLKCRILKVVDSSVEAEIRVKKEEDSSCQTNSNTIGSFLINSDAVGMGDYPGAVITEGENDMTPEQHKYKRNAGIHLSPECELNLACGRLGSGVTHTCTQRPGPDPLL